MDKPEYDFDDLVAIMARLRAEDGCPWDREQTLDTLKAYLIEEAYETIEAIEAGDPDAHCEELGDVLLQIVFQSRLREEEGHFDARRVVDGIARKLIRRHPHVFGDAQAETAAEVLRHWERIKTEEKAADPAPKGALDGLPRSLPALLAADRLGSRAARVGFDWRQVGGVLDKVREEIGELEEALAEAGGPDPNAVAWELGDLFFALANLSRHLNIGPEDALRAANDRFRQRFSLVEEQARQRGLALDQASLEELEALWQRAKAILDPAHGAG